MKTKVTLLSMMLLFSTTFLFAGTITVTSSDEAGARSHNELVVYPNPTNGVVYIETSSDIAPALKLYNLQGEQILETKSNEVDLSAFDKGVYLLQVNGEMVKVVKK